MPVPAFGGDRFAAGASPSWARYLREAPIRRWNARRINISRSAGGLLIRSSTGVTSTVVDVTGDADCVRPASNLDVAGSRNCPNKPIWMGSHGKLGPNSV